MKAIRTYTRLRFRERENTAASGIGLEVLHPLKQSLNHLLVLTWIFFVMTASGLGQNVSINNTGAAPDSSAMLDVQSTTQGFLLPRMTKAQRDAIPNPAQGLMIFQTDNTDGFYYYNDSAWNYVGTGNNSSASLNNSTDWESYTPTFTGFGTVSGVEAEWRRDGADVLIRGKFTEGIATAVEARMSLPPGLTSADSTIIPSLRTAGTMLTTYASSAAYIVAPLIEPSVTYLTFGRGTNSIGAYEKQNGNEFPNNMTYSFDARVPVQGWSVFSNGSSAGVPSLDSVLASGNDAGGDSILNLGALGVGTTTPATPLHVYNAGAGNAELLLETSGSNDASLILKSPATKWAVISTPGSGNLRFRDEAAALDRLIIDSSGQIGIGTTTPGKILHVRHSGDNGITTERTTNAAYSGHTWLTGGVETWFMGHGPGSSNFFFREDGTDDRMVIQDGTGYLGLGTTSPNSNLHILSGTGASANITAGASNVASLNFGTTTNNYMGSVRYDNSTNALEFWTNNTSNRMLIDIDGDVGIGTNTPSSRLHLHEGSGTQVTLRLTHASTASLGLWLSSDNSQSYLINYENTPLKFATNGADRMTIAAAGNVGIGTTNPTFKLDILSTGGTRVRVQESGTSFAGVVSKNSNREFFMGVQGSSDFASGEFHIYDNTANARRMVIDANGNAGINIDDPSSRLDVGGDIETGDANAFYFGDPTTDGTWRIMRSGNNLVFQRLESGVWVTKTAMTP